MCWATATREWAWERLRERHKGEKVDPQALHPLDGHWVWVSTEAPPLDEDEFA